MSKIEDLDEIGRRFSDMRRKSQKGKYAPVIDATFNTETRIFTIILELPSEDTFSHSIEVGEFWEKKSEIDEFLNTLKVQPEDLREIENRALPVLKDGGEWKVDTANLNKYKEQ